jgi:hypothetical protein
MAKPKHLADDGSMLGYETRKEHGDLHHGQSPELHAPGKGNVNASYDGYMKQFARPTAGPHRGQYVKDVGGKRTVHDPLDRQTFEAYHKAYAAGTTHTQVRAARNQHNKALDDHFAGKGPLPDWKVKGVSEDPHPSLRNPGHWDEGGAGHTGVGAPQPNWRTTPKNTPNPQSTAPPVHAPNRSNHPNRGVGHSIQTGFNHLREAFTRR